MRLPPLLASLTRHKLTVALMLLAIAFTCAIVVNLASMVAHRLALLHAPSGLDESSLVMVDSSWIKAAGMFGNGDTRQDFWPQYKADLAALHGIAGVQSGVAVRGLPMDGGASFGITAAADAAPGEAIYPSAFMGGPGELKTLGLQLIRGRDFLPSEYVRLDGGHGVNTFSTAIISRALAERLFHTDAAVGRLFYASKRPVHVVGVVKHLLNMSPQLGATDNDNAMLLPIEPDGDYVTFVLRTLPGNRDRVLKQAVQLLSQRDPQRIFDHATTFTEVRAQHFRRYSAMVGLLLAAGAALLIVTAAGIAGLASFWVQQRTRSIGIRRAVGARRVDILRYFQSENFLIVTGGVLLGCVLAYALNLLLMNEYALPVLPPVYLAIGVVALWLMGQLAVLGPALRAARVPPAVATRSV